MLITGPLRLTTDGQRCGEALAGHVGQSAHQGQAACGGAEAPSSLAAVAVGGLTRMPDTAAAEVARAMS